MREYTFRSDGCCNTLTTVTKDNYIAIGVVMRGRYENGKTGQKIELNNKEQSNSITTVSKNSLVAFCSKN